MAKRSPLRDQLGFDPREWLSEVDDIITNRSYHQSSTSFSSTSMSTSMSSSKDYYERSLSTVKDERDSIQKKTFTKWINNHLKKAARRVDDLFEDLKDGHNLLTLLEVLAQEKFYREKGFMRFHMLQNVQVALNFLHSRKIKTVNIRPDDIVDGNAKLTLGLIWTIILHFQISDIMIGKEDNVTAREALLRWAKKSTEKYPGVHVNDLTLSFRDGLAFSAIVHRNRSELIEWKTIRDMKSRDRLENVFTILEKEFNVTKLLEPEDVDTHIPDEKSMITYLSTIYNVFPEPPKIHPLFDVELQKQAHEYKLDAEQLLLWCREKTSVLQERTLEKSLTELKHLLDDLYKLRNIEVPEKQKEKQKLTISYSQLERYFQALGEPLVELDLRPESIEMFWHRLITTLADKEHDLLVQIQNLERLEKLTEKTEYEIGQIDNRITNISFRISNESPAIAKRHRIDVRTIIDGIETEIALLEKPLEEISRDCHTLLEAKHKKASHLYNETMKLQQRWCQLRTTFHSSLLSKPINESMTIRRHIDVVDRSANSYLKDIEGYTTWCQEKLKKLLDASWGSDLMSITGELELHQQDHKIIDDFHSKVRLAERIHESTSGDEYIVYQQSLNQLKKIYAELLSLSTKRLTDLDALYNFVNAANEELVWLSDREKFEMNRDWSDTSLDLNVLNNYYKGLITEYKTREHQFKNVLEKGESLLLQHPAASLVSSYLQELQAQRSWLFQLINCFEVHFRNLTEYKSFYDDVKEKKDWLVAKKELLESKYSDSDFDIDKGDIMLREMQTIREELTRYVDVIDRLAEKTATVSPLRERKILTNKNLYVLTLCPYKQANKIVVDKNETCKLLDVSGRSFWQVETPRAKEVTVPSICLSIMPPSQEAFDLIGKLKLTLQKIVELWQSKQIKLRRNMIFATIKVVREWTFQHFVEMGYQQRTAIRKALHDDANKIYNESDASDSQLIVLKKEMSFVDQLFNEFEQRASTEEESKQTTQVFNERCHLLSTRLENLARELDGIILSRLPYDKPATDTAIHTGNDYLRRLGFFESDLKSLKELFRTIPMKTPIQKKNIDKLSETYVELITQANLHMDRLKLLDTTVVGLEKNSEIIKDMENVLANHVIMPSTLEGLRDLLKQLSALQEIITENQSSMDQMNGAANQLGHVGVPTKVIDDLKHLHSRVERLNSRWNNITVQLVDRIQSVEVAIGLMKNLQTSLILEETWVETATQKLKLLPTVSHAIDLDNILQATIERTNNQVNEINTIGGMLISHSQNYDETCSKYRESISLLSSVDPLNHFEPEIREVYGHLLDTLNLKFENLIELLLKRVRSLPDVTADQTERYAKSLREPLKNYRDKADETANGESSNSRQVEIYKTEKEQLWKILNSLCIKDSDSGKFMTVHDAIRMGIYNYETGCIYIKAEKQELTLQEALERNYLTSELYDNLIILQDITKKYELNLKEKRKSMDESFLADKRVKVINANPEPAKSVADAIAEGLFDPTTGLYKLDEKTFITITEAYKYGYLIRNETVKIKATPLSFTDALLQGLFDENGWMQDRNSGERFQLDSAIENKLILDNLKEIVDTKNDEKMTVGQALKQKILNAKSGTFLNTLSNQKCTFNLAQNSRLICKPMTFKDLFDMELIREDNKILSSTLTKWLSLKEAIDTGVLDFAHIKSITKTKGILITLKEAFECGIIDWDYQYKDITTNEVMPIKVAVQRGLISSVSQKSLFDIDGFKDPNSECFLSLNQAIANKILQKGPKGFVIDCGNREFVSLDDGVQGGLVRPEVYSMLTRHIGVFDSAQTKELQVIDLVFYNLIDTVSGYLLDSKTHDKIPLDYALERQLITANGALLLSSLLNITLTTETVTKTVKRYVTIRNTEDLKKLANIEVVSSPSYSEAIKKKIITNRENSEERFANVQEALNDKSLVADTEKTPKKATFRIITKSFIPVAETEGTRRTSQVDRKESEKIERFTIEIPPGGWILSDCIEQKLFDPIRGVFVLPGSEQVVKFDDCIRYNLINPESISLKIKKKTISVKDALNQGLINSFGHLSTSSGHLSMQESIVAKKIVLKNPKTIDMNSQKILQITKRSGSPDTVEISNELGESSPTFNKLNTINLVTITKILKKITKKVVKLSDACYMGLIDKATLSFLENNLASEQDIENIDASVKVKDPVTGVNITIAEAIEKGILNPNDVSVLHIPFYKSLSLPELVKQGLIDKQSQNIIHPETGDELTLNEAIACDIVDKYSKVKTEDGPIVTLREAISVGFIDDYKSVVKTSNGDQNIVEAVEQNLFEKDGESKIPQIGMTFPVILQRNLVDPKTKEIIHPWSGKRMTIENAIKINFIMALPCIPPNPDEITLLDAINGNLINFDNATFYDANEEKWVPVSEAYNDGRLVTKPLSELLVHEKLKAHHVDTQMNNIQHTVDTKSIGLSSGYKVVPVGETNGDYSVVASPPNGVTDDGASTSSASNQYQKVSVKTVITSVTVSKSSDDSKEVEESVQQEEETPDENDYLDVSRYNISRRLSETREKHPVEILPEISENEEITQVDNSSAKLQSRIINFLDAERNNVIIEPKKEKTPPTESTTIITITTDNTPFKPKTQQYKFEQGEIETISLKDAINSKKIEPKICRIICDGNELKLTVQDALQNSNILPTDVIQVLSTNLIVLKRIKEKEYLLNLNRNFTEKNLREVGLYDPKIPSFIDAWTGNPITFECLVFSLDVIDPAIYVRDFENNQFVPIQEGFEKKLIDPKLGSMSDPKNGKNVPVWECVKRKWIIERKPIAIVHRKPSKLSEIVKRGDINFETNDVSLNGQHYSILEALQQGLIDFRDITVKDPANNDIMSFIEAVDAGIIDLRRGVIINRITLEEIIINIAFIRRYLLIGRITPVTLEAAITSGIYDSKKALIKSPIDGSNLKLVEAIDCGIIDPNNTEVKDVKMNAFKPLEQALTDKLIDDGFLRVKKKKVPLKDALKDNLIVTKRVPLEMSELIGKNYYNPSNGKILNPYTNELITIREAIQINLINVRILRIYDIMTDKVIPFEDAIASGLLDDVNGIITRPKMTLDKAYLRKIIVIMKTPYSLPDTVSCNIFDPNTKLYNIEDENLNLKDALDKNKIKGNELILFNPNKKSMVTINEAVKDGSIDPITSEVLDSETNTKIELNNALEKGLVLKHRFNLSLQDAVDTGLYDPDTGKFANTTTNEKLSLQSAINRNLIDVNTTLVKIRNKTVDFDKAIEDGIVDADKSSVKYSKDQNLDLEQAFDQQILLSVPKPCRLQEAVLKNLFDEKTGTFLDLETKQWLPISQAIDENLIDQNSVQIRDPQSGVYFPISIKFATQTGLIDPNHCKVNFNEEKFTLKDAFEQGILKDNKGPCSLQSAIHQGIYDDNSGRILDPFSNKKVTIHEAMKKFVINPHLPCYFDETNHKLLTLYDTCKLKIIDKFQGVFLIPGTTRKISLSEAMKLGYIIDIESANFTLYHFVIMRFYIEKDNKLLHPLTQKPLNLKQCLSQDLIDPKNSLIKNVQTGKYVPLEEAIEAGIIDPVGNKYIHPDSKESTLIEALQDGLIVSPEKPITVEKAIQMKLYKSSSGKFVDPVTNNCDDLDGSINKGFLEDDSTYFVNSENDEEKPLRSAIADGDVDVAKGRVIDPKTKISYNYDVAFERGLLISNRKPVKEKPIEPTLQIKTVEPIASGKPQEMTIKQAIELNLVNPEENFIKDPDSNRFVPLKEFIANEKVDLNLTTVIEPKSSFFVFSPQCVVHLNKPKTFDEAVESNLINLQTGKYVDPSNNDKEYSLKEAIESYQLDRDTILVKDVAKKKLVKLTDAFRKGLVDPERSSVVDTETSKLYGFNDAYEKGLIVTPLKSFGLLDAIDYNIYNPTSGTFYDPFSYGELKDKKRYSLNEALAKSLIDPTTTMVRASVKDDIMPISSAINANILDPVKGLIQIDENNTLDFVKAKEQGLLVPAEERQAVIEKFALCEENISILLKWINDIEQRISKIGGPSEQSDDLYLQISTLKQIKNDIDIQARPVVSCLEQVRQLVVTSGNVLSIAEVTSLENSGRQLRSRCDRANECVSKLLRHLQNGFDELEKLQSEIKVFNNWMESARERIEKEERMLGELNQMPGQSSRIKELLKEIIAYQADLRFITISSQKFVGECKDYLNSLNDLRISLPERLPHIEPTPSFKSPVRQHVSIVSTEYNELLNRVNAFADRQNSIHDSYRLYTDQLTKTRSWINDIQIRVSSVVSSPVATDIETIQEQSTIAKSLYNELISNGRSVDILQQYLDALLVALTGILSPAEISGLEIPVDNIKKDYKKLLDTVDNRSKLLDVAFVQAQNVQDALDNLIAQMKATEEKMALHLQPASLIVDRLVEQIREHQLLLTELEAHRSSLNSITDSSKDLLRTPSNARLAKAIESKLHRVTDNYHGLKEKAMSHNEFLEAILNKVNKFNHDAKLLEKELIILQKQTNIEEKSVESLIKYLLEVSQNRKKLEAPYEDCIYLGRELIEKRDVTDTYVVRDRMKRLEDLWSQLEMTIEDKLKLTKQKSEKMAMFELERSDVLNWLNQMELKTSNFEAVALDEKVIQGQMDEHQKLVNLYNNFSPRIDKLNDLSAEYDALIRSSPSPTSRDTVDRKDLTDLTQMQQELLEINNRFNFIGVRLSDRQKDLESTRTLVMKQNENLRILKLFLDKIEGDLPKSNISVKENAERCIKQVRKIQDEMFERQSLLDTTKIQVRDMVAQKPHVAGADVFKYELNSVLERWQQLIDLCKECVKYTDKMLDFLETHSNIANWLMAKEKLLTALGPISSEPRTVRSQMQQVQVIKEEFRVQKTNLDYFREIANSLIYHLNESSQEGAFVVQKMNEIESKWDELSKQLDKRSKSLNDVEDASKEFDLSLARLRDALQLINDDLDALPSDMSFEIKLQRIGQLERQLEGQRPLLADIEVTAASLVEIISDPASCADINARVTALVKQYMMLQKKLDNIKAENDSGLREKRAFLDNCARTFGWISNQLLNLPALLVSADVSTLQRQVNNHEPIFREVMSKEHEIVMLLSKAKDYENDDDMNDVSKISSQWEKLKDEVQVRQNRLQKCLKQYNTYDKVSAPFQSWLSAIEKDLNLLKPGVLTKKELEKELRDLQALRNEVFKKSGDYEKTLQLCDIFLSSCDIDKDALMSEMQTTRQRWENLSKAINVRFDRVTEFIDKVGDFNDQLKQLNNSVQRNEDSLASVERIHGSVKDPKSIEKIKSIKDENQELKDQFQQLRLMVNNIVKDTKPHGYNTDNLYAELERLSDRIHLLQSRLDDRFSELQNASNVLSQFYEKINQISIDIQNMENYVDTLSPPSREIKEVSSQIEDTEQCLRNIEVIKNNTDDAEKFGESIINAGYVSRPSEVHDQIDQLSRKRTRLDNRVRDYQEALQKALKMLRRFYDEYDAVFSEIFQVEMELKNIKAIGSELDVIRSQQQEFNQLRKQSIIPLERKVDQINDLGQDLIRSAQDTVSTGVIEKDLEQLNNKWNEIKENVNDRNRKLDFALLQSGKFQEALRGLLKWLNDSEEMVNNQKPPSVDYKVVKAQLQEQSFLTKMIADNQYPLSSIVQLGEEVANGCDPSEKQQIEGQLKDLKKRFESLSSKCKDRTQVLENAAEIAKQLQDKLLPLSVFLDRSEKALKSFEVIPTDEDKIQDYIYEHDKLHHDILSKNSDVNDLVALKNNIRKYFNVEESNSAIEKIDGIDNRYRLLKEDSEELGKLLSKSKQKLRHLVLAYQDLSAWYDKQERYLEQFATISVHVDVINEQITKILDIQAEVKNKEPTLDDIVETGNELIKHISHDDALELKDKLDHLKRRHLDITNKAQDCLKNAKDGIQIAQEFYGAHTNLVNWMQNAESLLVSNSVSEFEISTLESEMLKMKTELETVNTAGQQLAQLSNDDGASTVEGLITRDNRRFDAIVEQIQRKTERLQMIQQRTKEINLDLNELLEWFRDTENKLKEAGYASIVPKVVRVQLQEHRALNDTISGQKGRVREVTSSAKKLIRELQSENDDSNLMKEKLEDLKDRVESVTQLSSERLLNLEQVAPLSEHFADNNEDLSTWLSEMEREVSLLTTPSVRADQIVLQQEKNERLIQTVNNHKPLIDKFHKTGDTLAALVSKDDGHQINDIVDGINNRYNNLKIDLRDRQLALEKALQETSKFTDKLENMLRTLKNTADQIKQSDPASAHVPKISNQIEENWAVAEDLEKRQDTYVSIKEAANEIIAKAPSLNDPAVREIKAKLEKLNDLWLDVQKEVKVRDNTLNDTLAAAEKFWAELEVVMEKLRDLKNTLLTQEPPATEPEIIQKQKQELQGIKQEIDVTKKDVDLVRQSGKDLMTLCCDSDKPEIKKHIDDLETAWGNITALYAEREENLINAMEKAMRFHDILQSILQYLEEAEEKQRKWKPIGSEISVVKKQIEEVKDFKDDFDSHGVDIESLKRQANEISELTSVDQTTSIRTGVKNILKRWDDLKLNIVNRQKQLENALLQLGQFEHALNELIVWIMKTQTSCDQLKIIPGDVQLLEIEMAKLKIIINDVQAHQSSIDTLNDAGMKLLENDQKTIDTSATNEKLGNLNKSWNALQENISELQHKIDDELIEAQNFGTELQELLAWINDVDGVVGSTKPVGGLIETATEQLEKFMDVYNEIDQNRPRIDNTLAQGANYVKKQNQLNVTSSNLSHTLRSLKQKWEMILSRASDKKIKLEIALKEATEFHNSLQLFVEWLAEIEKKLGSLAPTSRVLITVQQQLEDHKNLQKEVSNHRETMLALDKKGTHLKYFSQKQDVILIKNLLVSVQHRWEKVVAKCTERTRSLDHAYKEAREFFDSWDTLLTYLKDVDQQLNKINDEMANNNDPIKLKQILEKVQSIQRGLSSKQGDYDALLRNGKALIDRAPKTDEPELTQMINEIKELWVRVCSASVEKQRRLEESLLVTGQFSEALKALLEWLQKAKAVLSDGTPQFGDIDTVTSLTDKHKRFEADLEKRSKQLESVLKTGKEIKGSNKSLEVQDNLRDVEMLWSEIQYLNQERNGELTLARKDAERLHKTVNMLMEWMTDAEQKLKYPPAIPSEESETQEMYNQFQQFMNELREKEFDKNEALSLAQNILNHAHPDAIKIIKNIIASIQSRWDEISQWAYNRENKLSDHLQSLKDLDGTIDDLMAWLNGLQTTLRDLEQQELPEQVDVVETLIDDHKEFMENAAKRQSEIDMICKPKVPKPALRDTKRTSTRQMIRTPSRVSPSDVPATPESKGLPHIGPKFPTSTVNDSDFRSPRAKTLWDNWRNTWMMAWDRQKRLHDHLMLLREKERIKSFDWDDWRKRFIKFHNHKRVRVVEFLRKIDKKQNGLIPREDFIAEIIKSKAPTKKHEMVSVADMFDHSHEGLIDWEEFLVALKPEWQESPKCEADKIHNEVRRLVMLCTCRQKFRVFQVGDGKYRFGESQKLRLVRILRSTVMVRVGGGWVALDEFLLKNDPCRARKTNAELREEFILAAGVTQTMAAFTPRPSITSNSGGVGKTQDRSSKSRTDSESESLMSAERRTPSRKTSIPVRSSATPGGSRPSSRQGSTLSLLSNDDATPSRIPSRRLTPATSRLATTSSSASKTGRLSKTPTPSTSHKSKTDECHLHDHTHDHKPVDKRPPFK